MLPPFTYWGYGIGYAPVIYPSWPVYPSGPIYPPVESSTSLQYTPVQGEYPSAESLPTTGLSAPGGLQEKSQDETLLYLKDGSVFAVASYTVSNGKLQYATAYGEQNDIDLDLLDLQKTIDANATRGVTFTLTPPPTTVPGAAKPGPPSPAPAPPGPITPPRL